MSAAIEDELRTALTNSGMRGAPVKHDGGGSPRDYGPPNIRSMPRPPVDTTDLVANGELAARSIREGAEQAASRLMLVAEAFAETCRRQAQEAGAQLRADADRAAGRVTDLARRQQEMSDTLTSAAKNLVELPKSS